MEKRLAKGNGRTVLSEAEIRNSYRVSEKEFRDKKQYEAALRDQDKIVALLEELDWENYESVSSLEKKLRQGISFETVLGKRFDDAVYEQYKELKVNVAKTDYKTGRNRKIQQSDYETGRNKKMQQSHYETARNRKMRQRETEKKNEALVLSTVDAQTIDYYAKQELKKRERRRRFVLILCSLLGVVCISYFVWYYYRVQKSENRTTELAGLIGSEALINNQTEETQNNYVHLESDGEEQLEVLPKYQTLYNSNRSLIGWLKIDDTIIDYPVMQCEDNIYYLSHNFDQEEDRAGSLFLDCNCDIVHENDNYIIYGHHMSSGKMFASLEEYEDEAYYEAHPYIQFDTIYREQTYQVMYVFRSRVYNEEEVRFKYYQFIDANSETEFQSYMNEMAALSFYETGVTASYGDQLLTLSTCDYNESNGRFVVVAKRIR